MKKRDFTALVAAIASQFALAGTATAASPPADFSFNYNPSLLQSAEGRVELSDSLRQAVRDYCRRETSGRASLRLERRCRQEVTGYAASAIIQRDPAAEDWRVRPSGFDIKQHHTGRPRA